MEETIVQISSDLSLFKWILGVTIMGLLGCGLSTYLLIIHIKDDTKEIKKKALQYEKGLFKYGNGIKDQLDRTYEQNRTLSHFVQVHIENETGKKPTPPI